MFTMAFETGTGLARCRSMLAMALDVLGIHSVAQWKNKGDEEVGVKVDGEWVGRGEGWKGGQSQAVKGSPIRMAVMTDASLKGVQHLHSLGHGIGCLSNPGAMGQCGYPCHTSTLPSSQ